MMHGSVIQPRSQDERDRILERAEQDRKAPREVIKDGVAERNNGNGREYAYWCIYDDGTTYTYHPVRR